MSVSIAFATLAHMINVHKIQLTIQYSICKVSHIAGGPPFRNCFGQLVSPPCINVVLIVMCFYWGHLKQQDLDISPVGNILVTYIDTVYHVMLLF